MLIPPRLNRLLRLLLETEAPTPVNRLAEQLGVSRRTVFREMENLGVLLEPYELTVSPKAGGGIRLEGPPDGRQSLLEVLRVDEPEPTDKHERLLRLLLELLRSPELQKIYYYAARFKVSEGTISNDLEAASGWLENYRLTLTRKPGLGISVEGAERDFRRALIRLLEYFAAGELLRLAQHGLLDADILEEVCAILRGVHDPRFERMTDSSQSRLAIYLSVVAERIRAGRTLTSGEREETDDPPGQLAQRLSDALEASFSISLSDAERSCVEIRISGAREKYIGLEQEEALLMDSFELQRLVYRMIDRFDSSKATELKMDEALVKGLTFHLRSAVVRLRHGLELQDPLLEQIIRSYPDIFKRSRDAAEVLWEEYRSPVSDSEAGFLSMHFGAAVMRLEEQKTQKRTVHVGVICINGIGVSYMMASQIKARFQGDVEVEVSVPEEVGGADRFDFCVSSIPFSAVGLTVLETNPILQEGDFERIQAEISKNAYFRKNVPDAAVTHDFVMQLKRIELLSRDIRSLLEQFHVVPVETGCSFNELVKLTGYYFGNSPENGGYIYSDLTARERISTQVVGDYGFVLLHARTKGVARPVFSLLLPENIPFSDPYLQGACAAVVMLAPVGEGEYGGLLGAISSALVEDTEFLLAVRGGDAPLVRARLEMILMRFLAQAVRPLSESLA